jgi:Ser/Thr protein kinase RdoA (MazF antagonist)
MVTDRVGVGGCAWVVRKPTPAVLHNDFARGNVLMDGDRCNGVLDFQFAGYDRSLCDYGAALYMLGGSVWGTPEGWKLIEAFELGFQSHIH